MGKDNPGVGEYDTQHLNTIAATEFQGGAANNFALFTRSHQLSMRQVALPEPTRFTYGSKEDRPGVGPGSYDVAKPVDDQVQLVPAVQSK